MGRDRVLQKRRRSGVERFGVLILTASMAPLTCPATASAVAQERPTEQALPDLVARIKPSIVTVLVHKDEDSKPDSQGTGWFIAPGQVVTNRHVVEGGRRGEIRLSDGTRATIEGVLAANAAQDLALLSVNPPKQPASIPLAGALPQDGQRIFLIGSPLGLEHTISEGIVSSVRQINGFGSILQITAPISPGSSGSPVLDLQGRVLGVATLTLLEGQAVNFAVSIEAVRKLEPGPLRSFATLLPARAEDPPPDASMAALEQQFAKEAGGEPNPAVLKMSRQQYDEAIRRLHPAFALPDQGVQRALEHGAAQRKRTDTDVFGRYSRDIGSDRVTPYFPLADAVYLGWSAAREYRPLPTVSEAFPVHGHYLTFSIQMIRANSTRELRDPKFVLRVGESTFIQAVAPPKGEKVKSAPYYDEYTRRLARIRQNPYTYYSTSFQVTFDLLNPDGSPRIQPADKEVTLHLVLNGEEKKLKFKLDEWTADSLPKPKR